MIKKDKLTFKTQGLNSKDYHDLGPWDTSY